MKEIVQIKAKLDEETEHANELKESLEMSKYSTSNNTIYYFYPNFPNCATLFVPLKWFDL